MPRVRSAGERRCGQACEQQREWEGHAELGTQDAVHEATESSERHLRERDLAGEPSDHDERQAQHNHDQALDQPEPQTAAEGEERDRARREAEQRRQQDLLRTPGDRHRPIDQRASPRNRTPEHDEGDDDREERQALLKAALGQPVELQGELGHLRLRHADCETSNDGLGILDQPATFVDSIVGEGGFLSGPISSIPQP